jgi:hypothetical protein
MTKETSPSKSKAPAAPSKAGKKDSKKPAGNASDQTGVKYNKLKKKHRYLREEYSKVLESWEMATKQLKVLLEERK